MVFFTLYDFAKTVNFLCQDSYCDMSVNQRATLKLTNQTFATIYIYWFKNKAPYQKNLSDIMYPFLMGSTQFIHQSSSTFDAPVQFWGLQLITCNTLETFTCMSWDTDFANHSANKFQVYVLTTVNFLVQVPQYLHHLIT